MIYAKLYTKSTGVAFYVAEGGQRGHDYVVWGMLVAPQFKFASKFQISLGKLSSSDWLGKEPCERREDFKPALWGNIERSISVLRQPLDQPSQTLSAKKLRRP